MDTSLADRAARVERRRRSAALARQAGVLWMLAPALLLYVLFMVYPFIESIRISLYDWRGLGPMDHFVGFQNYVQLLTRPPFSVRFWNAVAHNLFVLAFSVLTLQVPAIVLALLLNRPGRLTATLKVVLLLPWALSPVIVATLWGILLHPEHGAVNATLRAMGLDMVARAWFGDPTFALPAATLIGSWQVLGFNALIYVAAAGAIPGDVIEAAELDGAGSLRRAWSVIVPLLRPTILTMFGLQVIFAFSYFELIYLVTGPEGGPFYATDVLGTLFYRTAFGGFYSGATGFGQGAAISTLIALAVIPSSVMVIRLRRRFDVFY